MVYLYKNGENMGHEGEWYSAAYTSEGPIYDQGARSLVSLTDPVFGPVLGPDRVQVIWGE